jgi:hypothetical protein
MFAANARLATDVQWTSAVTQFPQTVKYQPQLNQCLLLRLHTPDVIADYCTASAAAAIGSASEQSAVQRVLKQQCSTSQLDKSRIDIELVCLSVYA